MKHTKKFFALLLALILSIGILSGCQTSDSPKTDSSDASSSQIEVTNETTTDGYQKQYCTATIDDPFHGQYVYVTLMPSASEKEYTLEDFPEYEFKKIDTIVLSSRPPEEPRIILELTLTNPSKENALEAIKILEQRPDAYSVNPDYYLKLDATPTDSYYTNGTQNEFNIISLPQAWNLSTGSNSVTVGIIDTGINTSHPELDTRVSTTLSKSFSDYYTPFQDPIGHGTAVASIIGAESNDSEMSGICWNVQLVSLNIWNNTFDEYGDPTFNIYKIISAIEYASTAGIDILNISLGFYAYYHELLSAISDFDGLVVCSAGNEGTNTDEIPHYPSSHQLINLISVGSSTDSDTRAIDSNYGEETVNLFAPGENIVCCDTSALNVHDDFSGTSYAAPMVAGVAALVLSKYPNTSGAQLKNIILNSTDPVVLLNSLCETGGRLNAYNAVRKHSHTFTNSYVSKGASAHEAYCSCGAHKPQPHTLTPSGSTLVCSKCGYSSISLNNQGLEVEMQ